MARVRTRRYDRGGGRGGAPGTRWALAGALVLSVVMVACGGGDDDASPTTTTSSSTSSSTTSSSTSTTVDDRLTLSQSCRHEERGVQIVVRYPEDWHVNGGGATPCSAFDPEPVNLRRGTEFPLDLAVVVRVEPVAFSRASQPSGLHVEDQRRLEVDGRDAVRLEGVSTGGPMAPEGRRSLRYVVDVGDERSIIATTWDVEGNDFELSKRALDGMVDAFDVEPREP